MFIKLSQTGNVYPYTVDDLKKDHPNTSFPQNAHAHSYPDLGVYVVREMPKPTINLETQDIVEGLPVLVEGHYAQTWIVVNLTEEQLIAKAVRVKEGLVEQVVFQTQQRLDDFAKTRGYDNVLSACTYSASAVTKFQVEGQYCVNARDDTWSTLYTIMAEVEAGTRPLPAGYADIEPLLPALVWPA